MSPVLCSAAEAATCAKHCNKNEQLHQAGGEKRRGSMHKRKANNYYFAQLTPAGRKTGWDPSKIHAIND
jgi:hypothetical protein